MVEKVDAGKEPTVSFLDDALKRLLCCTSSDGAEVASSMEWLYGLQWKRLTRPASCNLTYVRRWYERIANGQNLGTVEPNDQHPHLDSPQSD